MSDFLDERFPFNMAYAKARGLRSNCDHFRYGLVNKHEVAKYFYDLITKIKPRDRQLIFVSGGPNTGKTTLANCMVKQVYAEKTHFGAYLVRWNEFMKYREEAYANDTVVTLLEKCETTSLLIIDDFGSEESNPQYSGKVLLNLYKSRMDEGLNTIIMSSLSLSDLNREPWPRLLYQSLKAKVTSIIDLGFVEVE